jgi:tRNA(Glu) U13 pseudouridine synthase TruD
MGPLGEGTRRPLVLRVQDLHVTLEELADAPAATGTSAASETPKPAEQRANLLVKFVLAKGAYATTVLSRVVTAEEGSLEAAPESPAGQEDADSFAL